jgi:hypothetical protein
VTIGTPYDQADYIIESLEGEIASGTITSNTSATVPLDTTFQVTQSGYVDQAKGIRVRATGSNSIYILVIMKVYGNEAASYNTIQVYPNDESLSEEEYVYYAASPDTTPGAMNGYSNVLLVGNHDNTTVSIEPTQIINVSEDAQPNSDFVEGESNTTHTITLNSLQTFLMTNVLDLSGTKIVSNKPLTIISGHQCAQVLSTTRCEPMYIHLLPTVNWGQEFLLPTIIDAVYTKFNRSYKLVAQENSSTFDYNVRCHSTNNNYSAEGTVSFQIRYYDDCYLTASIPVFLVQVILSGNEEEFRIGDFTIVPPATNVKNASVIIPSSDSFSHYITVAGLYNWPQILLNGIPLATSCYPDFRVDELYACTSRVSSGTHTVSFKPDDTVKSVLVHGWSTPERHSSYSYLSSYNLGMETDQHLLPISDNHYPQILQSVKSTMEDVLTFAI